MRAAWPLWRGRGHTSLLCSTATQSPLSTEPRSRKEVTLAHTPKPESEQLELHKHIVVQKTKLSEKIPDGVRARPHCSSLLCECPTSTPTTRDPQRPDRKMAAADGRGRLSHLSHPFRPPRVSPYSVNRQNLSATWDQYIFIRYI